MVRKRTTYALVVLSLLLLAGCANMDKRTKCIASGAAIGIAIGAASGAVIGNAVENNGRAGGFQQQEGALLGAAAGGLIGGIVSMTVCEADVDTDVDGVIDDKDICPNTPAGCYVFSSYRPSPVKYPKVRQGQSKNIP